MFCSFLVLRQAPSICLSFRLLLFCGSLEQENPLDGKFFSSFFSFFLFFFLFVVVIQQKNLVFLSGLDDRLYLKIQENFMHLILFDGLLLLLLLLLVNGGVD